MAFCKKKKKKLKGKMQKNTLNFNILFSWSHNNPTESHIRPAIIIDIEQHRSTFFVNCLRINCMNSPCTMPK